MTLTMHLGRAVRSRASHRKSAKIWCTSRERRTRAPWSHFDRSTSWSTLKSPFPPGMARTIDRSSPSSFFHFFMAVRRCVGEMESKSSNRRMTRWAGSWMVMAQVPSIQPRTIFLVAQVALPFSIFLTDAGSYRCTSSASSKQRMTSSRELSRMRLTWVRCLRSPCTIPIKLSTYTSHDLTGRGLACQRRRSVGGRGGGQDLEQTQAGGGG
jgi:hypothetical protein